MRTLVLFVLLSGLLCNRVKAEAIENDSSTVAIEFVRVDGGSFFLGNTLRHDSLVDKKDERPALRDTLAAYYIAKYEITNGQWHAVMGGKCAPGRENYPKGNISYTDCMDFIDSLCRMTGKKFSLPTEAQWECAAKGGASNDSVYHLFSGGDGIDSVAVYNDSTARPVGSKRPNGLGLYDMSGNMFEWCRDNYKRHYGDTASTDAHVMRGGGFDSEPRKCRVTSRNGVKKETRKKNYGFRLVYIDDAETAGLVTITLPNKTDGDASAPSKLKYIYWGAISVAILGLLAVLWFRIRGRRKAAAAELEDDADDGAGVTAKDGNDDVPPQLPPTKPSPVVPTEEKKPLPPVAGKQGCFSVDADNCVVIGASVQGKGHVQADLPCQDSCKYTYLGRGWGIAVVSDGAGSASKSQVGSKIVVERATGHFTEVIKELEWMERNMLPTNEDWAQIAYSVLRRVHDDMAYFAREKHVELKELGATAIVMIHSPLGLLVTHVGDGRAGYRNYDGEWLPIIVPHKGEEANQTIFITSKFWDRPAFRLSGRLIPESIVIREKVTGFTLMSDGCENTSWLVSRLDKESGRVYDPNRPFPRFFDSVTGTLLRYHNENVDGDERAEAWRSFLDTGKAFSNETDDKTLILGIIL